MKLAVLALFSVFVQPTFASDSVTRSFRGEFRLLQATDQGTIQLDQVYVIDIVYRLESSAYGTRFLNHNDDEGSSSCLTGVRFQPVGTLQFRLTEKGTGLSTGWVTQAIHLDSAAETVTDGEGPCGVTPLTSENFHSSARLVTNPTRMGNRCYEWKEPHRSQRICGEEFEFHFLSRIPIDSIPVVKEDESHGYLVTDLSYGKPDNIFLYFWEPHAPLGTSRGFNGEVQLREP